MRVQTVTYLAFLATFSSSTIAAPIPDSETTTASVVMVEDLPQDEPPPIFDPPSPRPNPLFGSFDTTAEEQHTLAIADDALRSAPLSILRTETLPAHTGALVHPANTPYPPSASDAPLHSKCHMRRIVQGMLSVLLLVGVASALVWSAECFYRLTFTRSRRRSMSLTARRTLEQVKRVAVAASSTPRVEFASADEKLDLVRSLSPETKGVEKTRRFYLENYEAGGDMV